MTEKRIANTKRWHLGGFLSYYFARPLPSGKQHLYVLHFSPAEQREGRDHIARRIRKARANMQRSINELKAST